MSVGHLSSVDFGMSENRFSHLRHLASHMHSVSETELDKTDPWAYCNLAIDEHNAHWESTYNPSWLLAPDEAMCPWTPPEGVRPQDIPFSSHVPRNASQSLMEARSRAWHAGVLAR